MTTPETGSETERIATAAEAIGAILGEYITGEPLAAIQHHLGEIVQGVRSLAEAALPQTANADSLQTSSTRLPSEAEQESEIIMPADFEPIGGFNDIESRLLRVMEQNPGRKFDRFKLNELLPADMDWRTKKTVLARFFLRTGKRRIWLNQLDFVGTDGDDESRVVWWQQNKDGDAVPLPESLQAKKDDEFLPPASLPSAAQLMDNAPGHTLSQLPRELPFNQWGRVLFKYIRLPGNLGRKIPHDELIDYLAGVGKPLSREYRSQVVTDFIQQMQTLGDRHGVFEVVPRIRRRYVRLQALGIDMAELGGDSISDATPRPPVMAEQFEQLLLPPSGIGSDIPEFVGDHSDLPDLDASVLPVAGTTVANHTGDELPESTSGDDPRFEGSVELEAPELVDDVAGFESKDSTNNGADVAVTEVSEPEFDFPEGANRLIDWPDWPLWVGANEATGRPQLFLGSESVSDDELSIAAIELIANSYPYGLYFFELYDYLMQQRAAEQLPEVSMSLFKRSISNIQHGLRGTGYQLLEDEQRLHEETGKYRQAFWFRGPDLQKYPEVATDEVE